MADGECPVCAMEAIIPRTATRALDVTCPRCGAYTLSLEGLRALEGVKSDRRPILSSWIREQEALGSVARLTDKDVLKISEYPPLPFFERAKRLLVYLAKASKSFEQFFALNSIPAAEAIIQSFSTHDLEFVAKFLVGQGWLDEKTDQWDATSIYVSLTGDGFRKVDEWSRQPSVSSQGFVAMWFDSMLDKAWEDGLKKGIEDAGYRAQIIGKKHGKEHNNDICDEVIAEIRQSRFLVADFTGHSGGVYFEAGFAMGLGLPVIWTCKKQFENSKGEDIGMKKLHFDIRQYNFIDWEDPSDLRDRLTKRILAVIGKGPVKPS